MPAAPLRLSTTMGTPPQRCDICGPSSRAHESAAVPGVKGTMKRMGRDGYCCAQDSVGSAVAISRMAPANSSRGFMFSLRVVIHRSRPFTNDGIRIRTLEPPRYVPGERLETILQHLAGRFETGKLSSLGGTLAIKGANFLLALEQASPDHNYLEMAVEKATSGDCIDNFDLESPSLAVSRRLLVSNNVEATTARGNFYQFRLPC